MTTPTKTKKTKTAKPLAHEKATECIALGQLLQDHESSLITIEGVINDHAYEIYELKEAIKRNSEMCDMIKKISHGEFRDNRESIDELKEKISHQKNLIAKLHEIHILTLKGDFDCIFWITAIGFSIAIPLSVWAIIH
jgi:hypothetical protein